MIASSSRKPASANSAIAIPLVLMLTDSSDFASWISARISDDTSRLASATSLPMVGSSSVAGTGSRCAMSIPSVRLVSQP